MASHAAALGREIQRAGVGCLLGGFRAKRAGAAYRTEVAVLVGQLAVGGAGVIGQGRTDLNLGLAVLHAGHVLHVRHAAVADATLLGRSAGPQAVVGGHAVAVGHQLLHFGDVLVREYEIGRNDFREIEEVGKDRIDFVRFQRFRFRPRHRPMNVIPERGNGRHLGEGRALWNAIGQETAYSPIGDVFLGRPADQRRKHLVRLTEGTMAGSAFFLEQVVATLHPTRALGQTLEIRTDIDIPGGHFGRCRLPAQTVGIDGLRTPGRAEQSEREEGFREPEHC
ncbi:hypothetical protein SDC9_145999 [bioreactor metagenome]|uniref:Uncharacterized protein n=1 Tax=bioreactor metagenome TaxID=1076179 RepID=A0A645EBW1_9ZZZZ